MSRSERAWPGIVQTAPGAAARPSGMKAWNQPANSSPFNASLNRSWAAAHSRADSGSRAKPSSAYATAGSNRRSKGSLPNRPWRSRHAAGAPGTVTESQPRAGTWAWPSRAKRSGACAAGARPDPFSPCSRSPSQTRAKASEPMPLTHGCTTVSVAAAAMAASTALPPARSMRKPACAASGELVATTPLRASTGMRREG